ncbi:MAG: hypothetical protein ACKVY0_29050 [Prosthecobacter sp.]|uniref:hypothetical protein n=1 Tax=Prosthecobacter sp. TaxID=1965333 RepID=UPI0038FF1505
MSDKSPKTKTGKTGVNLKWPLLCLLIPLLVGGIHFGSQSFAIRDEKPPGIELKRGAPEHGVFAARAGLWNEDGSLLDKGRAEGTLSTAVTLWVRNLDGWLIDLAEANEGLMKETGLSPARWRVFHEQRKLRSSKDGSKKDPVVHPEEMRTKFREWLVRLTSDAARFTALMPPACPTPARLMSDDFPADAGEKEQLKTFQKNLGELVKKQPQVACGLVNMDGQAFTADDLTRFVADIGITWKLKLAGEEQKFQDWIEQCRQRLRLVIAGKIFASIPADFQGRLPLSKSDFGRLFGPEANPDNDTIHRLCFREITPSKEELEAFRSLVSIYGVDCAAPLTICLPLGGGRTLESSPIMRSLVNDGKIAVELPLRPVLLRSIAWGLVAGVISLILIVALTTGTLREAVPEKKDLIPTWERSPWSVSRVTFAMWLGVCTSCYVYLWAMRMDVQVLSGSAPLLLGIHGSTLLAASFIKASRQVQNLTPTQGFLMDLVTEGGEAEVSRLQMVVWNVVLGVVFVWQTFARWEMPEFDANLMALMGISSTAYVGYKWNASQKQDQTASNP